MDIRGEWKGFYEYGAGYTLPQFGKRVNITVFFEGSNDSFKGYVTEDLSEHSVDLKATIKGFIDKDLISFVKTYPQKPLIVQEGNSEKTMKKGILEIEHEGYVDLKNNSVYGEWGIYENLMDKNGSYESQANYGIWLLKKV